MHTDMYVYTDVYIEYYIIVPDAPLDFAAPHPLQLFASLPGISRTGKSLCLEWVNQLRINGPCSIAMFNYQRIHQPPGFLVKR